MKIERHHRQCKGEDDPNIVPLAHVVGHAHDNQAHQKREGADTKKETRTGTELPLMQHFSSRPGDERQRKAAGDDIEKHCQ